ncbi:hypothetical protein COBT_001087 [Conglomerata obtusa]
MNIIYIALFIWFNELLAMFVNNYIPDEVITKLTRIENTVESQLEIRNRNQYNEVFVMSYQVKNEYGHEEACNIIKNYLKAYSSLHNNYEFCITTLGKDKSVSKDNYKNKILIFMQNVARLYKQKAGRESLKYNNIHMSTSNRVLDSIKHKFATCKCVFISNCQMNDDDFALFSFNFGYLLNRNLHQEENYVFIYLKFNNAREKQNWLFKHPFESFLDQHDFLIEFKDLHICRHETKIFIEYLNDETKNYFVDQLNYTDHGQYQNITCGIERLAFLKHCLTKTNKAMENYEKYMKNIISHSYFSIIFKKIINSHNSIFINNLIEKSKKGEFISKNQFRCKFYNFSIEFLILRHKKEINLEEFPMNNNLFEIVLDIIIVKNDTIIGDITIKYIAHVSDIDSFYIPAYMLPNYKEELIGYEAKFNNFLQEVKKYFAQSFSDYDENKRICLNY